MSISQTDIQNFRLIVNLTGVHFWSELQHVGQVGEQKVKCDPIKNFENYDIRLLEKKVVHKSLKLHCKKNKVFSINDFFNKCDQIWSHLLKKSSIENFTFCAVLVCFLIDYWPKNDRKLIDFSLCLLVH